jgi:aromatic-amino-acid transaminase
MNAIRNKLADALAPIFDENVILTIKKGHGFFCQLPLKRDEIYQLKKEHAIYMTQSGRISLPGLKESSFDYVLDSIRKVKGL